MDNTYTPVDVGPKPKLGDQAVDFATEVAQSAKSSVAAANEHVAELGRSAADTVRAATDYIRDNEFPEIVADVRAFVRSHPTQALLGAAAFGFVAATLFKRR